MVDNGFNNFLEKYKPLIHKLVKKHLFITSYTNAITVKDLTAEAQIGLLKAYNKLKTDGTGNEMSYVYACVSGYIKNNMRLVSNITDKDFTNMTSDEFLSTFQNEPDPDMLRMYGCENLNQEANAKKVSYSVNFDDVQNDIEDVDDDLGNYQRKAKDLIENLFTTDNIMKTVLESKLGIGKKMTDEAIANQFNTTVSIVRNKFKKGYAIMKSHSEDI